MEIESPSMATIETMSLSPGGQPTTEALLAFEAFLHERVERGDVSSSTAGFYAVDVRQHLQWLSAEGIHISNVTRATLETWRDSRKGSCGCATMRRKLVSLRQFYGFLQANDLKMVDPTIGLESPPEPANTKGIGKELPPSTIQELLTAPNLTSFKGIRDRAILKLVTVHGLRVGELHRMNLGDVDLGGSLGGMLYLPSRRGRRRIVPLTDETRDALRTWLTARGLMHPSTQAVFISLHWTHGRSEPYQRLSPRGIRQAVDGYLVQVGIKQPGVSCDLLRFAAART